MRLPAEPRPDALLQEVEDRLPLSLWRWPRALAAPIQETARRLVASWQTYS